MITQHRRKFLRFSNYYTSNQDCRYAIQYWRMTATKPNSTEAFQNVFTAKVQQKRYVDEDDTVFQQIIKDISEFVRMEPNIL